MGAALEATAYIKGVDQLSPMLDEIARKIALISKSAGEVGKFSSLSGITSTVGHVADAERAMTQMTHIMDGLGSTLLRVAEDAAKASAGIGELARASENVRRAARDAGNAVNKPSLLARVGHDLKHTWHNTVPLVAGAAAIEINHGVKESVKAGAEIQGERARMGVAGISREEIAAADLQAAALAARFPNVTRAQGLETYKEARSVLLDPSETPHMMPTLVEAKSAMAALNVHSGAAHGGGHEDGLQFAVKAAEVMGLAQNPERFRSYLDSFIKAQQVMGKMITPEQQFQFAQMVKSSGIMLSDRFKMTTGVSLSQEMKGGMTGQSIDQFVKQIVGGFQGNNHAAAKQFVALGLADKDDFEHTKTGEIKGMKPGRKVKGADLAATDPDKWVYQYMMPAMEKAGITALNDQISMVRRMFPAGRAADVVSKMISQRESFANHAKLYDEAAGLKGAQTLMREDPTAALDALTKSLANFGGTVTAPIMKDAANAMSGIATTIGGWSQAIVTFQKDHPDLAKIAAGGAITGGLAAGGALGLTAFNGLTTGFGLKPASEHIDRAATKLEGAANQLAGGKPGSPNSPGGSTTPGGISLLGPAVLAATQLWDFVNGMPGRVEKGPDGKSYLRETEAGRTLREIDSRLNAFLPHASMSMPSGAPGRWSQGTFQPDASGYFRDYTLGSAGGFSKAGHLQGPSNLSYMSNWEQHHVAPGPMGADLSTLSGKIEATVRPDQVTAKVEGTVEGSVTVKIEATDGLKALIAGAKGGENGNFRMNVGTSAPGTGPAGLTPSGR